jgi:ABC-type phosphate transport system auxiliary subunit
MSLFTQAEQAKDGPAAGEPMVWFSGMWLAIGLLMIVTLLGVIVKNGLSIFWPGQVMEVELAEGSEAAIEGAKVLAGEVRKRQEKRIPAKAGATEHELQFFVGNRDAYGFGFRYVDESEIKKRSFPADILVAERVEDGRGRSPRRRGRFRGTPRGGHCRSEPASRRNRIDREG